MNIVYRLTNISKGDGEMRYYIGSKVECTLEDVNGIPTVVSLKSGLPYYGSSSNHIMATDMKMGHEFYAEILEEVTQRSELLETENKWIALVGAVESGEYYNLSQATIGGHSYNHQASINRYGETIAHYAKAKSSLNKRQNQAKKFGFKNMGEFCIYLHKQHYESGKEWVEIAKETGVERHYPARFIKPYNMVKCIEEYDPQNFQLISTIRKMVAEKVSIQKIAEIKDLEVPTVVMYVGEFDDVYEREYLTATRRGLTKEELEIKVTKMVLDGMSDTDVGRALSISQTCVKRYFMRCVRKRLKSSDL